MDASLSGVRPTVLTAQGVRFDSEGSEGFTIPPDGFAGWSDPVSARIDEQLRGDQPGALGLPTQLGSRVISVSGLCHARSPEVLEHTYGRQLRSLGADGRPFKLVVRHAGQALWVNAYRGSQPRFTPYPALGRASYSFDFWCPDPRKYGQLHEFTSQGASVPVFHRGDFPATPVFTVGGFASGYRIVGPGGLTYTVRGPKSGVDVIDFMTGRVTRGGQPLRRAVTSARRWSVPPGQEVQWRVEPITSGSGSAVMALPDTFI